jgi:hypothetical protein
MYSDEGVRRHISVESDEENSSLNNEQIGFGLCATAFSPADGTRSSFRKVEFFLQHDRKGKVMVPFK